MSPQQLVEGNAQPLGKEGQRIQCGGRPSPVPSLPAPGRRQPPASGLRGTPAPAPSRPGLQPRGLRSGEGHLWWFAWRGRRGTRGDRHSSRVEAKNPALISNRDGYLLELTGWTQGSQAS